MNVLAAISAKGAPRSAYRKERAGANKAPRKNVGMISRPRDCDRPAPVGLLLPRSSGNGSCEQGGGNARIIIVGYQQQA
jgi:hypothetical protein